MAVLRKMILVYPDAYKKLLQKINSKSSIPSSKHSNDFDKWLEVQQKMMEYKFKQDQKKDQSSLEDEPEKKKIKMELEKSSIPSKPNAVETALAETDEDSANEQFYSPKAAHPIRKLTLITPKKNTSTQTIDTDEIENLFSPKALVTGKKRNRKTATVTTVFDKQTPSPQMKTRSRTKNQKNQTGKSILNWKCF